MEKIINILVPGDVVEVGYSDFITSDVKTTRFKIKEAKLLKDRSIMYSSVNTGEFYNLGISENYFINFKKGSSPTLLTLYRGDDRYKTPPVGNFINFIKLINKSKLREFIERKEKCNTSCPVRTGMMECEGSKCEFFKNISGALLGDTITIETTGSSEKKYKYSFPLIAIDIIDKNKSRYYFSQNLEADLERISNGPHYPITNFSNSFRYFNDYELEEDNSVLISPDTLTQCDCCLFEKGSKGCYGCAIKDLEIEKLLKYISLC